MTPAGKRRSALNAMRHGLLAECTVLETESREDFDILVNMYLQRFDPVDGVDFGFIEEMASSYWRLRRGMMMEKTLLDKAVAEQTWDKLADSSEFKSICRYQTMLHRMFQRAMNNLLLLRDIGPENNVFPNEPSPTNEHSEPSPSPDPLPVSQAQSPSKCAKRDKQVLTPASPIGKCDPVEKNLVYPLQSRESPVILEKIAERHIDQDRSSGRNQEDSRPSKSSPS